MVGLRFAQVIPLRSIPTPLLRRILPVLVALHYGSDAAQSPYPAAKTLVLPHSGIPQNTPER
jgi:hypothetical protein